MTSAAFANTREVIEFESWLGLPFEDNLQRWLLEHPDHHQVAQPLLHLVPLPGRDRAAAVAVLASPRAVSGFRNLMAFVTFTALIIHLLFPLAPPRMMTGFVDTMREFGPSIYPKNALDGAANQIAAMPSLHFGWAMIEASPSSACEVTRWRWLVVAHPVVMVLAIIATGNHWWIDAAAAALIIIGATMVWRVIAQWGGDRTWSWSSMRFQTPTTSRSSNSSRTCRPRPVRRSSRRVRRPRLTSVADRQPAARRRSGRRRERSHRVAAQLRGLVHGMAEEDGGRERVAVGQAAAAERPAARPGTGTW